VHFVLRAVHRRIEQVTRSCLSRMGQVDFIGQLATQLVALFDQAVMDSQECVFATHFPSPFDRPLAGCISGRAFDFARRSTESTRVGSHCQL
jgi:hypothetical protein